MREELMGVVYEFKARSPWKLKRIFRAFLLVCWDYYPILGNFLGVP